MAKGTDTCGASIPRRRGDVSPQLVVRRRRPQSQIPYRTGDCRPSTRPEQGEIAIDNQNSAVIWHYSADSTRTATASIDFEESDAPQLRHRRHQGRHPVHRRLQRHCSTVSDAMTGKVHWTYDMLAAAWGSPLIVDNKVYIGDEDGEVSRVSTSRSSRMNRLPKST